MSYFLLTIKDRYPIEAYGLEGYSILKNDSKNKILSNIKHNQQVVGSSSFRYNFMLSKIFSDSIMVFPQTVIPPLHLYLLQQKQR